MITIVKVETIEQKVDNAERHNIYPLSNIENKKVNLDGWDITVTFPIEEKKHVKQGYIILSDTKEDGIQPFRIHNYEYDKNIVTITAYHVMFDTKDLLIETLQREDITVTDAIVSLNAVTDSPSPFTVTGTSEERITMDIFAQSYLEALKAIVAIPGVFITADWWDLKVTDKIGIDTGESISHAKNLYNFVYREDFDQVITRVYPFFQIGDDIRITLPEKYVDSEYRYNKEYTKAVQFEPGVQIHDDPIEFEDGTVEENPPMNLTGLIENLREQAVRMLNTTQFPKMSYKISSTLNVPFKIGDTVHFKHPALTKAMPLEGSEFVDLSIPIDVYSYEYDVVAGTLNALTYGDLESEPYDKIKDFATEVVLDKTQSITDFITGTKDLQGQVDRINSNIKKDLAGKQQQLDQQASVIENLNKNGHLVIYDNELYAVDILPLENAKNVLNLGQGGLTFSTNGINGPWNAAIGIDGKINASQILTGELDASIIKTNTIKSDALSIEARDFIVSLTSGRFETIETELENLELSKVWFGYSVNNNGNPMTAAPTLESKYIGTYTGTTRSTNYLDYTWARYKGEDGGSGTDGKGVKNTLVEYTLADQGETSPLTGWQTNTPEPIPGKYFWSRGTITYTDNSTSVTYNVSYIPLPGNGIKSTEVKYQIHTSGTTVPEGTWLDNPPTPEKGKYLWTRTVMVFDDNTSNVSYSTSYYAKDGQNGTNGTSSYTHVKYAEDKYGAGMDSEPGPNRPFIGVYVSGQSQPSINPGDYSWSRYVGEEGTSVTSITEYYKVSNSNTTAPTGTWKTTPPATSTSNRYLWNYELIEYSNGATQETSKRVIGTHGATGATGTAGKGISSTVITYQIGANGTTAPTGTWLANPPTPEKGKYLWTKTTITFTDSTTSDSYSVSYYPTDGQNGADGNGVVSSLVEYKNHTSGTAAPTGTWSSTVPAGIAGQYLWTRTTTQYKTGNPVITYSVSYTAKNGVDGNDGAPAKILDISATSQVIKIPKSGAATPSSIILTLNLQNLTGTATWSTSPTVTLTGTGNSRTLTTANMGTNSSVTVTASLGGLTDTITIVRLEEGKDGTDGTDGTDGEDAYTVIITNESHVFPGSTSAATAGSTSFKVIAYKGITQVPATIGAISGTVAGISAAITNNNTINAGVTVTVTTALKTAGELTIPITVDGKSFTKQFAYSISFKGATGRTGAQGISVSSITNYYLVTNVSTGVTTSTSEWKTTPDPTTSTNRYLWNYEKITYSNGTTDETAPAIIGTHGATGAAGADGQKGDTTYTWVRYADTPTSGISTNPKGKKYMGMAFNKLTSGGTDNYNDYAWSLMPQNITVGGRNLLLASDVEVTNGSYPIKTYTLTESIPNNETVTVTLWGELAATKSYFRLYNSGGSVSIATLDKVADGVYQKTFPWVVGSSTNTELYVYPFTSAQSGTSTISKIKLEKGDTPTDWSPAPEDIYIFTTTEVNTARTQLRDEINDTIKTTTTTIRGEIGSVGYYDSNLVEGSTVLKKAITSGQLVANASATTVWTQISEKLFYKVIREELIAGPFIAGFTKVSPTGSGNIPVFNEQDMGDYLAQEDIKSPEDTLYMVIQVPNNAEYPNGQPIRVLRRRLSDVEGDVIEIRDEQHQLQQTIGGFRSEYNSTIYGGDPDDPNYVAGGITEDIKTFQSYLDWDAPSYTLTIGHTDSEVKMELTNSALVFRSSSSGAAYSEFSHSGMYNKQWLNDTHIIKSFDQDGIRGTIWTSVAKKT